MRSRVRACIAACFAVPTLLIAPTARSQPRPYDAPATGGPPPGSWGQAAPVPAPPTPAAAPAGAPAPAPTLPALPSSTTSITLSTDANPASPPRASAAGDPAQAPPAGPEADRAISEPASARERLVSQKFLHGFRLGYAYVANYDKPVDSLGGQSLKDKIDMKTPHHFIIGYEGMVRMVGHSWLNVILVGNLMVAGIEQSKFYPTGNGLLGFEIDNSFQVGVGASLTPLRGEEAHAIAAAGWTPRVGSFYVPVHAFVIPDVDGLHRTGVTTGVTW